MRIRSTTPLLLILLAVAPEVQAEDFLPTPFTADQIGEAWKEGYEMTMRVWTPDREVVSRTRVESWSRDAIETSEQEVDDSGVAVGEKTLSSSTWESLRDHARFPAANTTRIRTERETALGSLEGWLYTVNGSDGSISEFFFADRYPGPPVSFSKTTDGTLVFSAETTKVVTAP